MLHGTHNYLRLLQYRQSISMSNVVW